MENLDIPPAIFFAMIEHGALSPHEDHQTFDINFYIVNQQFPGYMNILVEASLNDIERWAYLEGYMYYNVLENGMLQWHTTNRRFNG